MTGSKKSQTLQPTAFQPIRPKPAEPARGGIEHDNKEDAIAKYMQQLKIPAEKWCRTLASESNGGYLLSTGNRGSPINQLLDPDTYSVRSQQSMSGSHLRTLESARQLRDPRGKQPQTALIDGSPSSGNTGEKRKRRSRSRSRSNTEEARSAKSIRKLRNADLETAPGRGTDKTGQSDAFAQCESAPRSRQTTLDLNDFVDLGRFEEDQEAKGVSGRSSRAPSPKRRRPL